MTSPFSPLLQPLQQGLIVSCQAPIDSPLHHPEAIAAMAAAAVNQGAVAVRIDTPAHVEAVRRRVTVPIIGLWKQQIEGFEVYITPQFQHASAIAVAGADIIAIDATLRDRPGGETVKDLIARIQTELNKPVMADVDTLEAAIGAAEAGADLVGTTLYGYTPATKQHTPPGLDLLIQIVKSVPTPAICEGGIASPRMARQAIELGAFAVVVGTAITGIDLQVKAYRSALEREHLSGTGLETSEAGQFILLETICRTYRSFIDTQLKEFNRSSPIGGRFFEPAAREETPFDIVLLDPEHKILAGLVGYLRWQWLHIELLWVEESLRHQDYGSKLLTLAEQEAHKRGCIAVRLNTLSFQAKGFYEKLGYQIAGQLENYPPGQTHYLFWKALS